MSIAIDKTACTGCGACVRVCPGNLIKRGEDGRAFMRRPRDCWGCTACLKACPADAVQYFLGADMGGRGTRLSARSTPERTVWTFTHIDGGQERIVVDKREANKY